MGLPKAQLLANPNLLKLISKADQLNLGLAPPITKKLNSKPNTKPTSPAKPELQSHAEFLHWIKRLNRSLPPKAPLLALHADPAKPSGILPGWPDFTLFYSANFSPLFIEFKHPKTGRTSNSQALLQAILANLGHSIRTVTSSQDAISLTILHFNLPIR